VATTDETARQEIAGHLCATLEFVSDARLKGENAWPPYASVDGVLDESIALISGSALVVRGKLIWVDDRNEWWLEPFEATVELREQRAGPTYELRIGDASRGLRSTPYGSFQRREFVVTDWVFRLRNG
jgi:hypothetical protein